MEPDKPLDKNPLSRQQPAIEPPRASFILKNAATEGTILNAETQRNAEKKNPLRISLRTSAPSALNLRTLRSNWGIAVRRAQRNAEKRRETQRRRTLRESLDFGHSADWKAANPNGIASLSPGLRAARYPGSVRPHFPNPEKGCIL